MKKSTHKYKNSFKIDFMFNLVLILVAVVLTFIASKFFSSGIGVFTAKNGIIVYALAIVFSFCKVAIDTIEKLFCGKFSSQIIAIVSILLMFASKRYLAAAIIAILFSFCECVYNLLLSDVSTEIIKQEGELEYLVMTDTGYTKTSLSGLKREDMVVASEGDYLSFSYEIKDAQDKIKIRKPGYFNEAKSTSVKVLQTYDYDIDFDENCTKLSKTINFISYAICGLFCVLACVFARNAYMDGKSAQDAFYILSKYLLFAVPFAYTSGITQYAYLLKKRLAKDGVVFDSHEDTEKLASVKNIFFSQKGVVTNGKPVIKVVEPANNYSIQDVLKYCAIANNDISSPLDAVLDEYLPEGTITQNTSIINDTGVITTFGEQLIHFGTKRFMNSSEIDTHDLPEYTAFVAVDKKIVGSILLKDNLNTSAVKAVKIAKVLKLKTVLLSADCGENVTKINTVCDFDESFSNLDNNDVAQVLYMTNPKDSIAYISQDVAQSDDILTFSTIQSRRFVKPNSLTNFVKSISKAKAFKLFAYIRIAVASVINAAFAFIIYKNMFAEKLIFKFTTSTTAAEANSDKFSVKELLYKALIYNDELAPWLIVLVQAVLVIVFVLIAVMFDEKQPQETEEKE